MPTTTRHLLSVWVTILNYRRVDDVAQVENEVLRVYQQQLLEKENSGVSALLRDDKVRIQEQEPVTRRVL